MKKNIISQNWMTTTGCASWCFWLTQLNTWWLKLAFTRTGSNSTWTFEHWKGFASKLDIFCRDITTNTYKYFPNVKVHSNRFTLNSDELQKYVEALIGEFAKRGQDFQIQGPIYSYLIKPDLIDLTTIPFDLSLFEWMDVDNFEMQHIEFKSSELWTTKFECCIGNTHDEPTVEAIDLRAFFSGCFEMLNLLCKLRQNCKV